MTTNSNLIRVCSGTELTVNFLKNELENAEISCVVRNDFNSGISAGFVGGVPSSIDLLIQESDAEKAEPIIREFLIINS